MQGEPPKHNSLIRALAHSMVGNDLEKARKRMRNAWLAGFVWSGFIFVGSVGTLLVLAISRSETSETPVDLDLGRFLYFIFEVGLVAYLSYGVMQHRRRDAVALFGYFVISRIPLLAVGFIPLGQSQDFFRLLLQGVFAYFFFQGMRGVMTFHYLTHPDYPTVPPAQPGDASLAPPSAKDS